MAKRRRQNTKAVQVNDEPDVVDVKQEDPSEEAEKSDHATDYDQPQYAGLTDYEVERLKIMEKNRERLMALGLPTLMKQLQGTVHPTKPAAPKPKKKTAPKKPKIKHEIKEEEEEEEEEAEVGGVRRSSRIRNAPPKTKVETTEEKFERELGEFIVDGECPKCGRIYEKGHKAHLRNCGGPPREPTTYRGKEIAIMELSEEDRKDVKKRTLARMKALQLNGLIEANDENAKFIVLGSKGDPYTITLNDTKHKCTCLDHRFRRHNCKHICLVLSQLDILEEPERWKEAVEGQLSELIANSKAGQAREHPEELAPMGKAQQDALKFAQLG